MGHFGQFRNYFEWPVGKPTDHGLALPDLFRKVVGELNMDPDYQRDHVWTREQAQRFVGAVLTGTPVPPIYIQRFDSGRNVCSKDLETLSPQDRGAQFVHCKIRPEVIDGKQRLTALVGWLNGEFPAVMEDGAEVWFKDLDRSEVRGLPWVHFEYLDLSYENRLRFYLRLNSGGTVHSEKEISKVKELLAGVENG